MISELRDSRYEVRIFELMPLHMKMAVIEEGSWCAPETSSISTSTSIPSGASEGTRSTGRRSAERRCYPCAGSRGMGGAASLMRANMRNIARVKINAQWSCRMIKCMGLKFYQL